ncbi:MAG: hypothetical protein JST32_22495 [Bacteroidetes bacterium]|nr:hypothetical protein [Bacteroidota bacterium]
MKHFLPAPFLFLVVIFLATSCKKEKPVKPPIATSTRTLRFILYTNQDFSGNNEHISFSLHVSNAQKTIAFDSTVFSAKVKDIPDKLHQQVFEKKIPDDGTVVAADFFYTIENVGMSWYLDSCAANEKLKVIEYPFQ